MNTPQSYLEPTADAPAVGSFVQSEKHFESLCLQSNVYKFGGSSLANSERYRAVVDIVYGHLVDKRSSDKRSSDKSVGEHERVTKNNTSNAVVVSASGKTTDLLFELVDTACEKKQSQVLAQVYSHQLALVKECLSGKCLLELSSQLAKDKEAITKMLQSQSNINDILAYGEVWSAKLLSAMLNQKAYDDFQCEHAVSAFVDARDLIVCSDGEVNFDHCNQAWIDSCDQSIVNIFTGFIANDGRGNSVTLGRNGSDYSATVIAKLLGAKAVTIWTDTSGVYSADPRAVSAAQHYHSIPLKLAEQLAFAGCPVIHPKTLSPVLQNENRNQTINVSIANSFLASDTSTHSHCAGAVPLKTEFSHLGLEEYGFVIHNIKQTTFCIRLNSAWSGKSTIWSQLNKCCIENISLSELINEESAHACELLIGVNSIDVNAVTDWLNTYQLDYEVIGRDVDNLICFSSHPSILLQSLNRWAATQHQRQGFTGYGGAPYSLKQIKGGVMILPINSNSKGGQNVGVTERAFTEKEVNQVHSLVVQRINTKMSVGVVLAGIGNVGAAFLEQWKQQQARLKHLVDIQLIAVCNSKKALIDYEGLDVNKVNPALLANGSASHFELMNEIASNSAFDQLILIDITASEHFSLTYPKWVSAGYHIISANKCAGAADFNFYQSLKTQQKNRNLHWLYNTTIGAGLPINSAINDLINSGDQVLGVSGIFSGTLSWLCANYDGTRPFSELLIQAKNEGLTEPDPRDDLSGQDVQRKLLVIARELGLTLELRDISLTPFMPESLQGIPWAEFEARFDELDVYIADLFKGAQSQGKVFRYSADLNVSSEGQVSARVGGCAVAPDHPYTSLKAGDNIFVVTSHWYKDNPLIIQGPGAGRAVTAGGLHSDLFQLCRRLSSRS